MAKFLDALHEIYLPFMFRLLQKYVDRNQCPGSADTSAVNDVIINE